MSITESAVEEAALEWFGEQTRCAHALTPALSHGERVEGEHGPEMAPGEAAEERDSFGEVVLEGRLRRELRVVPFEFHSQSST